MVRAADSRGALGCSRNTGRGLGQAKVHQLGAGFGQHDVGRLQIAVHNSLPVRDGERLGDGSPDL